MHPAEEVQAILTLFNGEMRVSERETAERHRESSENTKVVWSEVRGKRDSSEQGETGTELLKGKLAQRAQRDSALRASDKFYMPTSCKHLIRDG